MKTTLLSSFPRLNSIGLWGGGMFMLSGAVLISVNEKSERDAINLGGA